MLDMSQSHQRWMTVLLLVGTPFVAGCGNEAVIFNNNIAKTTRDLDAAVSVFAKTIQSEKEPAKINAAYATLSTKTESIVAEAKKLNPPPKKEAQEFWQAFEQYLANREKLIKEDFKELVDAQVKGQPDRKAAVLQRIEQVEKVDLQRLRDFQINYAKANGIVMR